MIPTNLDAAVHVLPYSRSHCSSAILSGTLPATAWSVQTASCSQSSGTHRYSPTLSYMIRPPKARPPGQRISCTHTCCFRDLRKIKFLASTSIVNMKPNAFDDKHCSNRNIFFVVACAYVHSFTTTFLYIQYMMPKWPTLRISTHTFCHFLIFLLHPTCVVGRPCCKRHSGIQHSIKHV